MPHQPTSGAIVRRGYRSPYAQVPEALLLSALPDRSIRLWAIIDRYAGADGLAFPSRRTLADRLRCSLDSIDRALAALVEAGWLAIERRTGARGNEPSLYVLLDPTMPPSRTAAATPSRTHAATPSRTSAAQNERNPEREGGSPHTPPSAAPTVREVFTAWLEATGRTDRTVLDPKRRRRIEWALAHYPLADVLDAVKGWRHCAHNRGENERGQVYNDLTLLLRDAAHLERFRDLERNPPQPVEQRRLSAHEQDQRERAARIAAAEQVMRLPDGRIVSRYVSLAEHQDVGIDIEVV